MNKVIRRAVAIAKGVGKPETHLSHDDPQRWANLSKFLEGSMVQEPVFHNTHGDFNEFHTKHSEFGSHFGPIDQANDMRHHAEKPFGSNTPSTVKVHLNIKNPIRLRDTGTFDPMAISNQLKQQGMMAPNLSNPDDPILSTHQMQRHLKQNGYDGVVYLNRREGTGQPSPDWVENPDTQWHIPPGEEPDDHLSDDEFRKKYPDAKDSYIAFDPRQIKSAVGNNGMYDPKQPEYDKSEGGFMDPKNRALHLAKRIAKQGGGPLGYPPLMGEPAEEHTLDTDEGTQQRAFRKTPAGPPPNPALPVTSNQPPPRTVKPIMEPLTHKLVSDPNSLQGMKAGTPQKWANSLAAAGVKKEELEHFGIGGPGNNKLTREDIASLVRSRMPKIRPRVLGDSGSYQHLVSGDPDAEEPEPPEVNTRWGDWEHDEPDSYYIDERARERAQEEANDEYENPEFAEPHIEKALHSFKEQWLQDTPPPSDSRAHQFAIDAIEHGWVDPKDAEPLTRQRHINDDDWKVFTDKATQGAINKFGHHEEDTSHLQDALPGMEMHAPYTGKKTETSEWLKPFGDAVCKLHGFGPDQQRTGIMRQTPEDAESIVNLPRSYSSLHQAPNIDEHVKDHIGQDDDFIDSHRRQAEQDYYEDDESPQTTTVTAEGADGDPDYTVHQAYGEYTVRDPRGRHVGDYHSWNRADDAILDHARENYPGDYDPDDYDAPVYETRHVPRDNINIPDVEGGRRYESHGWNLPGLENRREIPIEFEPPSGQPDYHPPHFDLNTLGHMRVGDWHTADGKRILHIDELQSDLHQAGAKEGYFDPVKKAAAEKDLNDKKDAFGAARQKIVDAFPEIDWAKHAESRGETPDIKNDDHYRLLDYMARTMQGAEDHDDATYMEKEALSDAFHKMTSAEKEKVFGIELKNGASYNELWNNFHKTAKARLGDNYHDIGTAVRAAKDPMWDAQNAYNRAARGNPSMPWKDSSDFGRMMMRVALRHAAEYGYDGISLSPGFIQTNRWSGHNHNHLYDNIFGGAMDGVAKEAKRFTGAELKTEHISNPHVAEVARKIGHHDTSGNVKTILFHHPENVEKIKDNSLPAFKRGGVIPNAKDARRAVMIARKYADGGVVAPELNSMGMYSAAAEAAKNMGQAKGPKDQMYRTLQKGPNVRQDELDYTGVKDWMDQQPGNQIHKNEIANYLRAKQMPITDTVSSQDAGDETKFGPGVPIGAPLPGSRNYKELRMTLPKSNDGMNYYSSNPHHFTEPNIVAHARFDDRTTPEGKKLLHIAEIQSDWAKDIQRLAEKTLGKDAPSDKINALMRDGEFLRANGLPPHPFPGNWHEFAMKRLLAHAGQNGYDGISWDTGDTQADRYDLSHQVKALHYDKNTDGSYNIAATPLAGSAVKPLYTRVKPDDLERHVGHDMSNRMQAGVGTRRGTRTTMEGDDLKIGTEGMKNFYDGIIKSYMNRLAQKRRWDTRTEFGQIGDHRAHTMMFPAAMKEDLHRGLPMQRGGRVRRGYMSGGAPTPEDAPGSFTQPMVSQEATEAHVQDPQGNTYRKFFTDPDYESKLPAGSKVIKSQTVAPLFHSNPVKALSGDTIPMKSGSIQQWMNKLKDKGAKDWEIKRMGLHKMDPKMQVGKDELLQRAHAAVPTMGMTWLGSPQHEVFMGAPKEPALSTTMGEWKPAPADPTWMRQAKAKHLSSLMENPVYDPKDLENARQDVEYYANDRLRNMRIGSLDPYYTGNFLNPDTPGWTQEHTRQNAARNDQFTGVPSTAIDTERAAKFVKTAVERGWAQPETAHELLPSLMSGHINQHAWNDFLGKLPITASHAFLARGTAPEPQLPGLTDEGEVLGPANRPLSPAIKEARLFDRALDNIHRGEKSDYYEMTGDAMKRLLEGKLKHQAERAAQAEHDARTDAPQKTWAKVHEGNSGAVYGDYQLRHDPSTGKIEVRTPYGYQSEPPMASADTLEEIKAKMMEHAIASGGIRMPDDVRGTHKVPTGNIEAPEVTHGDDPHGRTEWHIPEMKNYRAQTIQFQPEMGKFNAGHYGPRYMGSKALPNTVWHIRGGDLPDDKGHNIYVHDELQDDWARSISKGGGEALTPETAEEIKAAEARKQEIEKETDLARSGLKELFPQNAFEYGWDSGTIGSLARVLTMPHSEERGQDFSRLGGEFSSHHINNLMPQNLQSRHDYLSDLTYDSQLRKNYMERLQAGLYQKLRRMPERQAINLMKTLKSVGVGSGEVHSLNNLIDRKKNLLPDRPWQKSSDMARLAIWAGLRHAADYGHEGYAILPGWVHYKRWAHEQHHLPLYDNMYSDTLKKVANELKVPAERIHLPALERHAKRVGYDPNKDPRLSDPKLLGKGTIPDFRTGAGIRLTPELRHFIKTNSRGLKTGGRVVEDALRLTQKYVAPNRASLYKSSK